MNNSTLYNFCCANETRYALIILDSFNDIDVLYKEGVFFDLAVANKNISICKALLNYFETTQFPVKNQRYEEAKEKLTEVLENATDGIELSKEMKEVLAPYIDFEDSIDERLNDSFLEDITIPFENETFNSSEEERGLVGNNEPITNHNSEVISH